jgi:hypothetical protein
MVKIHHTDVTFMGENGRYKNKCTLLILYLLINSSQHCLVQKYGTKISRAKYKRMYWDHNMKMMIIKSLKEKDNIQPTGHNSFCEGVITITNNILFHSTSITVCSRLFN